MFKLAIPYSHAKGVHDVLVQGFENTNSLYNHVIHSIDIEFYVGSVVAMPKTQLSLLQVYVSQLQRYVYSFVHDSSMSKLNIHSVDAMTHFAPNQARITTYQHYVHPSITVTQDMYEQNQSSTCKNIVNGQIEENNVVLTFLNFYTQIYNTIHFVSQETSH